MDNGPSSIRKYDYSPKICGICGKTFERPANQRGAAWAARVYCSHACVIEARRRKAYEQRPERTCPICGEKFRTSQPLKRVKTCGKAECKSRYRYEISGPRVAAKMREAYAAGTRLPATGISARELALVPLLRPHGWKWRMRWFDEAGCFELDFAHFDRRINVEIDGVEHGHPKHRKKDEARDAALAVEGWTVVRIANAEVDASPEAVAARVLSLTA